MCNVNSRTRLGFDDEGDDVKLIKLMKNCHFYCSQQSKVMAGEVEELGIFFPIAERINEYFFTFLFCFSSLQVKY